MIHAQQWSVLVLAQRHVHRRVHQAAPPQPQSQHQDNHALSTTLASREALADHLVLQRLPTSLSTMHPEMNARTNTAVHVEHVNTARPSNVEITSCLTGALLFDDDVAIVQVAAAGQTRLLRLVHCSSEAAGLYSDCALLLDTFFDSRGRICSG